MRRPLVAGNWKMNGSEQLVLQLVTAVVNGVAADSVCEVAIIPPFTYLSQAKQLLNNSPIKLGAQTLSEQEEGAYTGEISATMLHEMGCDVVLVGHSERRSYYGESDDLVAKKLLQAQRHGLTPILCVGETLEQRQQEQTLPVLFKQLDAVINANNINVLENFILAYEPVWAIGTGQTASPEQAQQVHQALREYVAKYHGDIAANLRILYGGSVKPDNFADLIAMPDIDGGLIGGASLKSADFLGIIQQAR